jgi:hypothetical protein
MGIFLRKEMKSNDGFNEARRYIMKTKNYGNSQHLYVLNSLFPAWFTQTYMNIANDPFEASGIRNTTY